ncbi:MULTISPECIES: DUF6731 family protein [Entomomonas]|uniref:Uncharacterized protein n=1 Tax=Entomomonas asaccharolytica TaxID=2785331 RepID=A0A974NEB0_9GAMM|nr:MULTISPECIES: DUF6731 family protein [Entomomonas]QQP85019.1 hypothetical protein JHT90_11560 [Entomomonas asaccharolytica]UYZ85322.1 hypothetical protein MTZ49_07185 [Entomomonas sp. E2T0]
MSDPLQKRKYTIDFFQITIMPTAEINEVESGFEMMMDDQIDSTLTTSNYLYDLWGVKKRTRPVSIAGEFRKFRKQDLEYGLPKNEGQPLDLGENGLIEKNCFVYYPENQILGWCRNGNACTTKRLETFLQEKWGTDVSIIPVIRADAIKRLLSGNSILKRIEITVPKPTNPDMIPSNDFSAQTLQMLNSSDADSMYVEMRIDGRKGNSNKSLKDNLKFAVRELFEMGATKAKAVVDENGAIYPIDLIADRVYSIQEIETNGNPPSGTIHKVIDSAMNECRESINEYFGTGDKKL